MTTEGENRPVLPSTHSKRSMRNLNELDGSLHISTHGGGLVPRPVPPVITNAEEPPVPAAAEGDAQSVTEGSDGEFADPALLNDNDDDSGSFCDADETCSADPQFLRRGMSVGPDELEDFLVEFGDEIKEGAYYDEDDGYKIDVPKPLPKGVEDMADDPDDDAGEEKQEEKEEEAADAEA